MPPTWTCALNNQHRQNERCGCADFTPRPRTRDGVDENAVREALTLCRLAAAAIYNLGPDYAAVAAVADAAHDLIADKSGVNT